MHPHGHHGGHNNLPNSFWNWGGGWPDPGYSTVYVEQAPIPTWVYIGGGVLAGALLALLSRK